MRALSTIFFYLVLVSTSAARTDSIPSKHPVTLGVNVFSFLSLTPGIYASPALIFSKGKHSFYAAPKFLYLGESLIFSYPGFDDRLGIMAGYRFYPNGKSKVLNLYFHGELQYARMDDEETEPIGPEYSKLFEITLGYGIRINFLRKFYVNQSIGAGILNERYHTGTWGYNITEGNVFIALGLGYDFK